MNYYSFHLGDYAAHTRHLSLLEDLAYRRMLDLYYTTEHALPADPAKVARLIGMRDHMQEVTDVLSEFFTLTEAGHTSARCEREIDTYKAKAERAKSANKARWTPKGGTEGSEPSTDTDTKSDLKSDVKSDLKSESSQIPTKNQEPITKEEPPIPPKGGEPVEQKPKAAKATAIALQTHIENCRKAGTKSIPEGHAVFAYAEKVGIPDEFLRLHWFAFRDRYTMDGAKRYKSWPQAFQKSVMGNWYRLWYVADDGSYHLTTVGQQAQRQHAEAA